MYRKAFSCPSTLTPSVKKGMCFPFSFLNLLLALKQSALVVCVDIPTATFCTSGICWLLFPSLCLNESCNVLWCFIKQNYFKQLLGDLQDSVWCPFFKQWKHKLPYFNNFSLSARKDCVDCHIACIWCWSLWLLQYILSQFLFPSYYPFVVGGMLLQVPVFGLGANFQNLQVLVSLFASCQNSPLLICHETWEVTFGQLVKEYQNSVSLICGWAAQMLQYSHWWCYSIPKNSCNHHLQLVFLLSSSGCILGIFLWLLAKQCHDISNWFIWKALHSLLTFIL